MTIAALVAAGPALGTYTDATLTQATSTFTGTAQGGGDEQDFHRGSTLAVPKRALQPALCISAPHRMKSVNVTDSASTTARNFQLVIRPLPPR